MSSGALLARLLFVFAIGFAAANLRVAIAWYLAWRIRRSALVTWESIRPTYYRFSRPLAVLLAVLFVYKLVVLRWPLSMVAAEAMMLVYYGFALPAWARIRRGLYAAGVLTESGFLRWQDVASLTWREEGERVTLVLVGRRRRTTRVLVVPGPLYGQVRARLRERIKAHDVALGGIGLDLGGRSKDEV